VCPYCAKAKKFLNLAGAKFHAEELNQRPDGDDIKNALHKSITGCETVPQVFIHGKFIGTILSTLC
jgi:glutaredoxin